MVLVHQTLCAVDSFSTQRLQLLLRNGRTAASETSDYRFPFHPLNVLCVPNPTTGLKSLRFFPLLCSMECTRANGKATGPSILRRRSRWTGYRAIIKKALPFHRGRARLNLARRICAKLLLISSGQSPWKDPIWVFCVSPAAALDPRMKIPLVTKLQLCQPQWPLLAANCCSHEAAHSFGGCPAFNFIVFLSQPPSSEISAVQPPPFAVKTCDYRRCDPFPR